MKVVRIGGGKEELVFIFGENYSLHFGFYKIDICKSQKLRVKGIFDRKNKCNEEKSEVDKLIRRFLEYDKSKTRRRSQNGEEVF